jgi:Tfp pilus assembly protein PilF
MKLRSIAACLLASTTMLLGACVTPPVQERPGLIELSEQPAERALLAGLRAYDDAAYPQAEKQLQTALQAGLRAARDRAAAHKLLAFVYCTSNRVAECEAQFRSARAADPGFALSRSEAGHPLWGPVWQRVQQP